MPVPKQRHTKSRRNKRRSHHALKPQKLSFCPKCKTPVLSHTLCMNCGTYNTREVVDVLAKLSKKERKQREKEEKARQKEEQKEGGEKKGPLSLEKLSRR